MAKEEEMLSNADEKPSGGGMMKMLILGAIGLLLVTAGIFGGPVIKNMISPPDEEEQVEGAEAQAAKSTGPVLYNSLHPPLVVNLKDSAGDTHFMQITMEIMARNQDVINAVREHTPVIRNNLILLYGTTNYEDVTTRAGKEKMLADGLSEIRKVMSDQIGEPGVEALYFTSLIIQ